MTPIVTVQLAVVQVQIAAPAVVVANRATVYYAPDAINAHYAVIVIAATILTAMVLSVRFAVGAA